MAHITSIGASKFTTLDYVANTANNANSTAADLHALFVSNSSTILGTETATDETKESAVKHVGNIREFPSLGTPANIVNVPVYGQAASSQVAGQSDAPTLEFTLNYVPADHAGLDVLRKSATRLCFRVRIADADITTDANGVLLADNADKFADFYFFGTVASFEISPSLSDSLQATIAVTIEGDFNGPFALVADSSTSTYALPA
ncbi:hypothetical protein [Planktomarina sp.]|uniref:hypothetical protein n=1 Tax=Planktomarina sp. TaxID=2024851 RepID=UPI0032616F2E